MARICRTIPGGLLLVVAIAAAAACGGGKNENSEVEDVVRATAKAWTDRNISAFAARLTDEALVEEFGATRLTIGDVLRGRIGEPPITPLGFSVTSVEGDAAATVFESAESKLLSREKITLRRENNVWRILLFEDLPVEIPAEVARSSLGMSEFGFIFDETALTGREIAFQPANFGAQDHEVTIFQLADNRSLGQLAEAILAAAKETADFPPGVGELVAYQVYPEGDAGGTMVFAEALEPGRYGLFCFIPDSDDPAATPHALKGMVDEFTIK